MKIQQKSLGLLGLSIGMGSLLSLTPVDLVHGAEFSGDLMSPQNEKIGHIEFTFDQNKVSGDSITNWRLLDTFLLTDNSGVTYDRTFFENAFVRMFNYDLTTGDLMAKAYQFSPNTDTGRIGFSIERMEDTLVSASRPVNANPVDSLTSAKPSYSVNLDFSRTMAPIEPVVIEEPPNDNDIDDIASVPESSVVTSLLMIAGFVLIGSKKAF